MNPNIKPIEVTYKGIRFRSKTEAKWARLFDLLKIEYIYEPDGFHYKDFYYAPDFLIPKYYGGLYAEVKPATDHHDPSWAKIKQFQQLSNNTILYLGGSFRHIYISYPRKDEELAALKKEHPNAPNFETTSVEISRCAKCQQFYFKSQELSWQCQLCDYHDGDRSFDIRLDFDSNEIVQTRTEDYFIQDLRTQIKDITNFFRYDPK